jgi:hypothetical protein
MRRLLLVMCLCMPAALPEEQGNRKPAAPNPQVVERYQQRMATVRAALQAQVAAYDSAERSFRRATAEEAAALLPPTQSTAVERPLPGGGFALPADLSQLQFFTVQRLSTGDVVYSHQPGIGKGSTTTAKGGANVR